MQTEKTAPPRPEPDAAGNGVHISTDDARAGYNFGVWKILVGSLLLVIVGYALVSMFFIGASADGA